MQAPQPRSLILDIYGAYVRRLGGWLAIADLIRLMAHVGHNEQAVRRAASRMKKSGLLVAETRERAAGYCLSDEALAILRDGDERIFNTNTATDLGDGWVLAVFSVPERLRDQRHQLRRQLAWLGFGQMASGVWMAPRRMLVDAKRTLQHRGLARYVDLFEARHEGFEPTVALIARTWDLAQLARLYRAFVRKHQKVLDRWRQEPTPGDQEAFVDYTLALAEWRRLPYMDPGLPAELLPPDWIGQRARALFVELDQSLQDRAFVYVVSTVRRREGP
ncbi:MAG: PaaX family transcriptional regulator [Acidimicrobiales bacterium]